MPADDPSHESRHFSRITLNANVRISGAGTAWHAELVDVSLRGALVARPDGWDAQPGAAFELRIALGPEQTITMQAHVAHVEPERVGFCCDHIDVESITHLRRVVELNTGDPELLHRELSALGRSAQG